MNHTGRLPVSILFQAMCRSLLLQASWNFGRLQNVGFLFTMAPALRWLYQGDELERAFARHLEKFNTHPYLAGPILGVTLELEAKRKAGKEDLVDVESFKEMTMAPYGAMGDSFFWGAMRPLAAVLALFFALHGSMLAPLVFILVFNIPHLWCRLLWFWKGYHQGLSMVQTIRRWEFPDLAIHLKGATVVLLGIVSAYLVFLLTQKEGIPPVYGLLVAPLACGGVFMVRKGLSPLSLLMGTAFLVFLVVGL
jgi:PTS system mannose-specific IID component